tara:strand:+ start:24469 stop:25485 length:1017 start_codon:yes stop_codon:yes gene_type:complete
MNQTTQAGFSMRRLYSLKSLTSAFIPILLLILVASRFNYDWSQTWASLASMDPWFYCFGFVSYYLSFLVRGLRWRVIASNVNVGLRDREELPSVVNCSKLILAGWFVNAIGWFRIGDAYRAYKFARDSRSRFSHILGTILAERALDLATIVAILLVVTGIFAADQRSILAFYLLGITVAMLSLLVLILLFMRFYGIKLASVLPVRFRRAYQDFQNSTLGSFKNLRVLVFLGTLAWLLEIARLYFVIESLGLSVSLPLMIIVALGSSILSTVPTPGGIGAVESGVTALLMISLGRPESLAITLLDRSITYLSVVILGGAAFLIAQIMSNQYSPNGRGTS